MGNLGLISAFFGDHPTLALIGCILYIIHIACRVGAELCLYIAAILGQINKTWARRIGKTAWLVGRVFMAFSSGLPERYLKAKYQERGPKI